MQSGLARAGSLKEPSKYTGEIQGGLYPPQQWALPDWGGAQIGAGPG